MLSLCRNFGRYSLLTTSVMLLMHIHPCRTSAQEPDTVGSAIGFSEVPLIYSAGGRTFEGVVVRRNASPGLSRPAVIIAHDFLGEGKNTLDVARKLVATLGYVAVGADFYGRNNRPHDSSEALAMAKSARAKVPELRMIMRAAYDATAKLPGVDAQRIAVLGYGVGGVAALELARTGADLRGVALLWAILDNSEPTTARPIKAKVLMEEGALDPFAPPDKEKAFEAEMKAGHTDLSATVFPGVAHAYTLPSCGTDVSSGYAYNAAASEASWQDLTAFLEETLRQTPETKASGPRMLSSLDARWGSFYVGGSYLGEGAAKTIAGKLYVQSIEPLQVTQPYSLVMIPGTGQTGNNFFATPDDRSGWAIDFARSGYRVYVVDQVGRGRSGTSAALYGKYATVTTSFAQFVAGLSDSALYPQARLHTQWPGGTTPGDPVFDQFMASHVEFVADATTTEEINLRANIALLEKVGPAIVLTHSQAGAFGWKLADSRPDLVRGLVAVEPNGPPFKDPDFASGLWDRSKDKPERLWGLTRLPLSYEPATDAFPAPVLQATSDGKGLLACWLQPDPARKLPKLAKVPIAIVTGEASFRATYDHCSSKFLTQAGVANTHIRLENLGVKGNAHMMMLEKNSSEIAGVIANWLETTVRAGTISK